MALCNRGTLIWLLHPASAACAQDGLGHLALYDVDILAIRKLVIYDYSFILSSKYSFTHVSHHNVTCASPGFPISHISIDVQTHRHMYTLQVALCAHIDIYSCHVAHI